MCPLRNCPELAAERVRAAGADMLVDAVGKASTVLGTRKDMGRAAASGRRRLYRAWRMRRARTRRKKHQGAARIASSMKEVWLVLYLGAGHDAWAQAGAHRPARRQRRELLDKQADRASSDGLDGHALPSATPWRPMRRRKPRPAVSPTASAPTCRTARRSSDAGQIAARAGPRRGPLRFRLLLRALDAIVAMLPLECPTQLRNHEHPAPFTRAAERPRPRRRCSCRLSRSPPLPSCSQVQQRWPLRRRPRQPTRRNL